MGRMFRIISESGTEVPKSVGEPSVATLEPESPDIPYIEIGGPEGLVTSIPKVERTIPAQPHIEAAPQRSDASSPPILSVTYHKLPKTGLRILPSGLAPEIIAYHHPDHPVAAEYRNVGAEIRSLFQNHSSRVLGWTAAAPESGTTTVVLNLAVIMAQEFGPSSRVLLIDANLLRPTVAYRLGNAESPGLVDVLSQSIPLSWVLQATSVPNLQVLPAGNLTDPVSAATYPDFSKLITQLKHWFDWILIDLGVWNELGLRKAFVSSTDAVFLVTREQELNSQELLDLKSHVTATGSDVKGYISTKY